MKKRAFISFDYDHDLDIKTLLVGQAKTRTVIGLSRLLTFPSRRR